MASSSALDLLYNLQANLPLRPYPDSPAFLPGHPPLLLQLNPQRQGLRLHRKDIILHLFGPSDGNRSIHPISNLRHLLLSFGPINGIFRSIANNFGLRIRNDSHNRDSFWPFAENFHGKT